MLAANFIQRAGEKGIKIKAVHKINRGDARIMGILATPLSTMSLNTPSSLHCPKTAWAGIFVASDDALIYAKVVGGVETRGDSIVVVGSEKWLDETAIDLDRYQSLGIILHSPNYASLSSPQYKAFPQEVY